MHRVQYQQIREDLDKKMVMITGPRQAGKTWLAKHIAEFYNSSTYLNYDQIKHREIIAEQGWMHNIDLLVLDELHKMPNWKNYLKGVYDTKPEQMRILVTGSARLEIFHRMGDSLAGRYFLHRLLPFSPAELKQLQQTYNIDTLLYRGGFPEPYLAENKVAVDRWRGQYINNLLSTDVFEFDKIQNIKAMRLIFELLRHRIGSSVSYQSLAEDVNVSVNTIKKYIQILEALYVIFLVTPFSKNIARSILKEPKVYFFDNGLVGGDEGIKLENLTAICLQKHIYAKADMLAENYKLHYLRTKEKQEVDFALVHNGKIEKIIEVKLSNTNLNNALIYFHKKYALSATQIVKNLLADHQKNNIKVIQAKRFLEGLYL